MANRFSRYVDKIYTMPAFLHSYLLTKLFCSMVKFAGTARVKLRSVSNNKVQLTLANNTRIQNHIGGVHAVAAALLAESASGIVLGMNVPDDRIPLLKSMKLSYQRKMQGSLTANARLSDEQIQCILTEEKGEMLVDVDIFDESQQQPIVCEMLWAWIPKIRKTS